MAIREITEQEFDVIVKKENTSVYNFMGGFGSDGGDLILIVHDKYWFIPKEDRESEKVNELHELQNEEGKEYMERMF